MVVPRKPADRAGARRERERLTLREGFIVGVRVHDIVCRASGKTDMRRGCLALELAGGGSVIQNNGGTVKLNADG